MARPDIRNYLNDAGKSRRKKRRIYAGAVILLSAYLFALIFCLLSFRTGIFRANSVEIAGNYNVSKDDTLTALTAQVFGGSKIKYALGFKSFLIWPDKIKDAGRFLPQVKSLDIQKYYWDKKIVVRVTERIPYGIWCAGTDAPECFWFDEDGYVFKRGLSSEGNIIKSVSDISGRPMGLGSAVLPDDFFSNLKSIFDVLEKSGIGARSIELKDLSFEEVIAKTAEGPVINFSLRFSSAGSLDLLKTLKSGGSFSKLQYVDLRIQNRAYYK